MPNPFELGLNPNPANQVPLTPVSFLRRAALAYPDKTAVVHGERRYTYRQFLERSCRLASALAALGMGPGDCVAVMAFNSPEMPEAHYGVPMLGAVLNSLNTRLDAQSVGFILNHGGAKAPRTVIFGELPKTSTGKVQKFVLRGRAREL